MSGISVQPCCCANGVVCEQCANRGPLYWEVTLSGLADNNPTDCPACERYDATYTLRPGVGDELGTSGICACNSDSDNRCCWVCYINPNEFDCVAVGPYSISLTVTTVAGVHKIMVTLLHSGGAGEIVWEKEYDDFADCRNLEDEELTFIEDDACSSGTIRCTGAGATCFITAVSSPTEPCCRDYCYPDETPGPITITVSNLTGGACGTCSSLNGVYIVDRQTDGEDVGSCWVGQFAETCGMDTIRVTIGGPSSNVLMYNAASYPSGNYVSFPVYYTPFFASYFTAPYANCNQWNGKEFRSFGDSCGVSGSYASAYTTF